MRLLLNVIALTTLSIGVVGCFSQSPSHKGLSPDGYEFTSHNPVLPPPSHLSSPSSSQ